MNIKRESSVYTTDKPLNEVYSKIKSYINGEANLKELGVGENIISQLKNLERNGNEVSFMGYKGTLSFKENEEIKLTVPQFDSYVWIQTVSYKGKTMVKMTVDLEVPFLVGMMIQGKVDSWGEKFSPTMETLLA